MKIDNQAPQLRKVSGFVFTILQNTLSKTIE